jgi:hypothetical protein
MADINWIRSKRPCTTIVAAKRFINTQGTTYPTGAGDDSLGCNMVTGAIGDYLSYAGIGAEIVATCADSSALTLGTSFELMVEALTGKLIAATTGEKVVAELIDILGTPGVDGDIVVRVVSYYMP